MKIARGDRPSSWYNNASGNSLFFFFSRTIYWIKTSTESVRFENAKGVRAHAFYNARSSVSVCVFFFFLSRFELTTCERIYRTSKCIRYVRWRFYNNRRDSTRLFRKLRTPDKRFRVHGGDRELVFFFATTLFFHTGDAFVTKRAARIKVKLITFKKNK